MTLSVLKRKNRERTREFRRYATVYQNRDPFVIFERRKGLPAQSPKVELDLLDTGHVALEEVSGEIAERINSFLG